MVTCLHGLGGSQFNNNYALLSSRVQRERISNPQIDYPSISPYQLLEELNQTVDIEFVVGNSFGGFFAYVLAAMRGLSCILVNPCIPPAMYIARLSSEYPLWYLRELDELTRTYLGKVTDPHVILGMNDEVLMSSYTKELLNSHNLYEIQGGHSVSVLNYSNEFTAAIDTILNIAEI